MVVIKHRENFMSRKFSKIIFGGKKKVEKLLN